MPNEQSAQTNGPIQDGQVGDEAVVTKVSPWPMADTLARLTAVIAARGMEVIAIIDHSGEARDAGLDMPEMKLVLFGSPSVTAPVVKAAPLAALDLPLRVLVCEDGYQTLVSYPAPEAAARRHGLDGDLAAALHSVDAVTAAVIDR